MKKKFYYAGMLAAGLLTFASCNNDDDPIIEQNPVQTEEEAGQVIRIAVANTGDGLTTRAGRPLFSSVADQTIDKVVVYIVSSDGETIVANTTYTNWSAADNSVSQPYDNHGRYATWKLTGENRLDVNADYTAYAVGYTSTNSLYNAEIEDFESLTTVLEKFAARQTISDGNLGEEIFAGALTFHVDGEGNIDVSENAEANVLTLHRQVAGTLGYFISIPTVKSGEYVKWDEDNNQYRIFSATNTAGTAYNNSVKDMKLRLVASNISSDIYFDYFNSTFTEANADNSNAWFIVNGAKVDSRVKKVTTAKFRNADLTEGEEGYVFYTINLGEWFPNGDVNNDGLLDDADAAEGEENWNTPADLQGASFVEGSVFSGTFVIPFVKKENQNTLQLQLLDASGNVMRIWNISLPEDDRQIYPSAGHASVWDGKATLVKGFPEYKATQEEIAQFYSQKFPFAVEESANSYSFVRNHLYTIGEKATDEVGPGDNPQPLSKGQNIILKVNDNWEMLHHMVVD